MTKYVFVTFQNNTKEYAYLSDDNDIGLDAYAVVVSEYGAGPDKLEVVKIQRVEDVDMSTYEGNYKYIVASFSLDEYNKRLDASKRKKAIEKELRRRISERKLVDNFETLLAGDEEAKKLIEEYKGL